MRYQNQQILNLSLLTHVSSFVYGFMICEEKPKLVNHERPNSTDRRPNLLTQLEREPNSKLRRDLAEVAFSLEEDSSRKKA
jgi:hypothetical protein